MIRRIYSFLRRELAFLQIRKPVKPEPPRFYESSRQRGAFRIVYKDDD